MNDFFKIKPSANILKTIGSELIKDPFAAIIELVKNSYDADSTIVNIDFDFFSKEKNNNLNICIEDNGHGMSPDVVINCWLVPATPNKSKKAKSPSGRYFLGKKGIGRYASAILGNKFKLTTIDSNNNMTTIEFDWSDFSKYDYLEDVPIKLHTEKTELPPGTKINIISEDQENFSWNKNTIDKLLKELSTLISPLNAISENAPEELPFDIYFNCNNNEYLYGNLGPQKIQPINLINFYNYRIYGTIGADGFLDLTYENACEKIVQKEKINISRFSLPIDSDTDYCGKIFVDLRVFDRDPSDIQILKEKIEGENTSNYFNKLETRELLNEISGVKLYRNNFRIRPYGDINSDWLSLDKERVQNPSMKIGNNQICGNVIIDNECDSNLIERSSREGLKENSSYYGLVYLLKQTLIQLEMRRASYRKKSGKGRQKKSISDILKNSVDFHELNTKIDTIIVSNDKSEEKKQKVNTLITSAQIKTETIFKELNNIIATYQGQATLGKIVMVLLHEGSKPIQGLKSMGRRLIKYNELYNQTNDETKKLRYINNIVEQSESGLTFADMLTNLFGKIKPLAFKAKLKKDKFNVSKEIETAINIFENELELKNIKCDFKKENIEFYGYKEDILTTITNLIENSIYWLSSIESSDKKININIVDNEEYIDIFYRDNGPGIDVTLIESQIIFDPDFTTKDGGTGLGLAICGEALSRNNGEIKAIAHDNGAYFTIRLNR